MHWNALPAIAIFATLLAVIVRHSRQSRRRSAEIAAMSSRLGLRPRPRNSPPPTLSLEGTEFQRRTQLYNIYEGSHRGLDVAFFDISRNAGKSGWSRTVIAVRTSRSIVLGPSTPLTTHPAGLWQLLYVPRTFMYNQKLLSASAIEEILQQVAPLLPAPSNP